MSVSTRRYIWVRRDRTVPWRGLDNPRKGTRGNRRKGECLGVGVQPFPTIPPKKEKVITVCRCAPAVQRWMEEEEVSAKDQAKIKKKNRGARHVSSKQHLERSRRVFASTIESERIFLFRGFSDENWPFSRRFQLLPTVSFYLPRTKSVATPREADSG